MFKIKNKICKEELINKIMDFFVFNKPFHYVYFTMLTFSGPVYSINKNFDLIKKSRIDKELKLYQKEMMFWDVFFGYTLFITIPLWIPYKIIEEISYQTINVYKNIENKKPENKL